MKCPFCGVENTRVIDSRPADEGAAIRRRRQCDACNKRFTTYEKVDAIPLVVVTKDMNREPYDRAKIEAGVFRSCHKRPISVDQIKSFVDDLENEIFAMDDKEIESTIIGELLMEKLKSLDPVAYVRFASIYREFKDVNTFMDEIKKILE
jgi:transcriptional repressor NrdR